MISMFIVCLFLTLTTNTIFKSEIIIYNEKITIYNSSKFSIQNVSILMVNGSSYQMGYQQGSLLYDEIHQNLRAFTSFADDKVSNERLMMMWNYMEPFIPIEYIQEMHGIADGAQINFMDIAKSYMIVVWLDLGCITAALWGNATINHEMIHVRSLDFPLTIQDPVSKIFVHENQFLLLRNPDDRKKTLAPTVAGTPNFGGGFSESKIAIGNQVCQSKDNSFNGTPIQFRIQQALEYSTGLTSSISYLIQNKTTGWNQIIADASTNQAYAIETTAHHDSVTTWNSDSENIPPFNSIPFVLRRTNLFLDPETATTQRTKYDPSGLSGFLSMMLSDEYYFTPYMLYQALSDLIQNTYGKINDSSLIENIRELYSGHTDIILYFLSYFLHKIYPATGFMNPWHQWVCNLESGDLYISFATKETPAHKTQICHVNIYELFDSF